MNENIFLKNTNLIQTSCVNDERSTWETEEYDYDYDCKIFKNFKK